MSKEIRESPCRLAFLYCRDTLFEHIGYSLARMDRADTYSRNHTVWGRRSQVRRKHATHGVAYDNGPVDLEMVEQTEDILGNRWDGCFRACSIFRSSSPIVVEDDAPVGREIGEDWEIVILRRAKAVHEDQGNRRSFVF